METAHVLIADITGSTNLYDRLPDQEALVQISTILSEMRSIIKQNGGHCVKSKGDDTLSFFSEADHAFQAARSMIEAHWEYDLGIHAGVAFGEVLMQDGDIYGDAVNTAARFAGLARPGEVMIGDMVYEKLTPKTRDHCVSMGGIKLKGKAKPIRVHSFTASAMTTQTVVFGMTNVPMGPRTASVALTCDGSEWTLHDGDTIMVGRALDCKIMLDHPWVSRMHGKFDLRSAQLEYTDHSSSGSTVITSGGQDILLQRRSMLLSGEGLVLIGTRDRGLETAAIRFATNDLLPD